MIVLNQTSQTYNAANGQTPSYKIDSHDNALRINIYVEKYKLKSLHMCRIQDKILCFL